MKKIFFVTTNPGKMREATGIGRRFGITFVQNSYDCFEVQSDNLGEVAGEAAKDSFAHLKTPLIVEDSGVFIDALKGFPGPYSAYVYKTVGTEGVLKLMEGLKDRKAVMRSSVAYADGKQIKLFNGEVSGIISDTKKGSEGFGYDPIFIPDGKAKTFAEDTAYKLQVSHRAKALRAFCEWFSKK